MVHIVAVDDDAAEHSRIQQCIDVMEKEYGIEATLTSFYNGDSFLLNYSPEFDIILMDIDMPGMNGLDCAKELRRKDDSVIIIFVTNMAQCALQGYEVDALDFIVKPINPYSFSMKLKRAVSRIRKKEEIISIKTEEGPVSVSIGNIYYIEVQGHYILFHTSTGIYQEYNTLKNVESKITDKAFTHCNRCYLVNMWYIKGIIGNECLISGERLLISHPQRKAFLKEYADFIGGGRK